MRAAGVIAIALAGGGCSLFLGSDDSPGTDGGPERDGASGDGGTCVDIGTRIFSACADRSQLDSLPAGVYTLDTDSGELAGGEPRTLGVAVSDGARTIRVIAVREPLAIEAGVSITARGTAPLVIAAPEITVDGVLDLGAAGVAGGAGFDPARDCADRRGDPGSGVAVIDGGGGGGFQGSGGDAETSSGGMSIAAQNVRFEGGCPGGAGGLATGAGAPGGSGGGAVLLVADTVTVGGTVHAGGGGGQSADDSGGGGGGSGGLIYLAAETIEITGTLAANGGGGGGGGAGHGPGNDATASDMAAVGGGGGNAGGSGSGGPEIGGASSIVSNDEPRGGGGGGAGFVIFETANAPDLAGVISPAQTVVLP